MACSRKTLRRVQRSLLRVLTVAVALTRVPWAELWISQRLRNMLEPAVALEH